MIRAEDITFAYSVNGLSQKVLKNINFQVGAGEFVALLGPSGSGKSTLFHILGGLLKPTSGKLYVQDQSIYDLSDEAIALFRNQDLGFVFQQFFLLPRTSVVDNILLPAKLRGDQSRETSERAENLAIKVGLKEHLHKKPNELSGGQQQRVAIARALLSEPRFLLADEPTGNLDSRNAAEVFNLFCELNAEGSTLLWVTHDRELAQRIPRRIVLKDGEIESEELSPMSAHKAATRVSSTSPAQPTLPTSVVEAAPPYAVTNSVPDTNRRTKKLRGQGLRQVLPLAFCNLTRNKSQSFLTMLGVIFGVSAVLAMMTLGIYAKRRILEGYQGLGINKIVLRGWPKDRQRKLHPAKVSFRDFNLAQDVVPLKQIFPELRFTSPVLRAWDTTASFGGVSTSEKIRTLGVNEEYFAINNLKLREGIPFYPYHIQSGSQVCLIGGDIANQLFPRRSPVGEMLGVVINEKYSFPCRIIGTMETLSSNSEGDKPDTDILIPFTYFQRLIPGWNSEIHMVAMQIHNGVEPDVMEKKLKGYFINKYGPTGEFNIDKDAKLLAQMTKFLNIFSFLLFGISLLALVVGGMGINNMMLISISERFREIGLRKALGASQRFIRKQILTESVILAIFAGFLGLIMGFALYQSLIYAATRFIPKIKFEWIVEPMALSISLISIVAVGILSGLIPALKASKLEVIEALRSE